MGASALHHRTVRVLPILLSCLCIGDALFGAEKHQLLGTWQIEASKLTIPNAPRSVTITLSQLGREKYRMSVDIVDYRGTASHGEGDFTPDGTTYPAKGSLDVDIVALQHLERHE